MKRFTALILSLILIITLCACSAETIFGPYGEPLTAKQLDDKTFYYYKQLNEKEQKAYGNIYNNISEHPEKIRIAALNDEELSRVFLAFSYDNPEIICLSNTCRAVSAGGRCYFVPNYLCSANECKNLTAQFESNASEILSKTTPEMSDYDKELYFHDALFNICDYDNSAAPPWTSYTAAGALVNGSAVCEGYSRAMQYLLNEAGIENHLITGKAVDSKSNIEGHMWNIVSVDGKNYHLDSTWDDPTGISGKTPSHAYFNLTDKEISRNHSNFSPADPNCSDTEFNYHRKNGQYFEKYNNEALNDMVTAVVNAVKRGDDAVEFAFGSKEEYEKASKDLFKNKKIHRLFERANIALGQNELRTNSVEYHEDKEMFIIYITLK